MSDGRKALLLTCEHASYKVPSELKALFAAGKIPLGGDPKKILRSHRGWDPGADAMARLLGRACHSPPLMGEYSRLVVDLNRSPHHPKVFSPVTRGVSRQQRAELLARYHVPHWQAVVRRLRRAARAGRPTLHMALHSFTPEMHGVLRQVDLGLLYDPRRPHERRLADEIKTAVRQVLPHYRIRRNQPYRGQADGLPTAIRRHLPDGMYAGFELELNQACLASPAWLGERRQLTAALCHVLERFCFTS